jgi:hypothetical protein
MAAYATTAQLADYLDVHESVLPMDAARLLERATELVQYATLTGVPVPEDSEEVPVDEDVLTVTETLQIACQKAVCAQVEYWIEQGEGAAISGPVKSFSIGKFSMQGEIPTLAPRARQFLVLAGLLYRGVGMS